MTFSPRINRIFFSILSTGTIAFTHPPITLFLNLPLPFGEGVGVRGKNLLPCLNLVPKGGLEPPRSYPPDPESGASAIPPLRPVTDGFSMNKKPPVLIQSKKFCQSQVTSIILCHNEMDNGFSRFLFVGQPFRACPRNLKRGVASIVQG